MSYDLEYFAQQVRGARQSKRLSQRELSKLAGVPQAHISRIESAHVDLRISSLIAITRALELELVLVPRSALPAVQSIARQAAASESRRTGRAVSKSGPAVHATPAYTLDEDDD